LKFEETLNRLEVIRNLERETQTRVITFYKNPNNGVDHGKVNEESYVSLCSVLDRIGDSQPVSLVIHSHGGSSVSGTKIAMRLKQHTAQVTVIVPEEAFSAATEISLVAGKILCGRHAHFTPLDPQFRYNGNYVSALDVQDSSDPVLVKAAQRALSQADDDLRKLLRRTMNSESKITRIADRLLLRDRVHPSHGSLIEPEELMELSMNIEVNLPASANALHNLYKQHSFTDDDPSIIVEYSFENAITDEDIVQSKRVVSYYIDEACPNCGEPNLIMDREHSSSFRRCPNCPWNEFKKKA
jgi:ATP-dependent protease ClpP protease subunit/predicted RNA-binding Zn-ribbon protein involved in translation (DUF1610 family)